MAYNVLIVDDSKIIRSVVRKAIGMAGLDVGNVFEAGNGKEALEVLSNNWVDIVFSDISMPQMNGFDLVQQMAANQMLKTVPVVMVSSEQSDKAIEELKKLGVSAYIRKPFRPEDFRNVIEHLLGHLLHV